jgi:hypothetical protein
MRPNICAVCSSNNNGFINTINFGRLYGVFCCDNKVCRNIVKKDLITYINETNQIPLYGMTDNSDNSYKLFLNFYRSTKGAKWKGYISRYTNIFCIYKKKKGFDKESYFITLQYNNKNENKIQNAPQYFRSVTLDNIMFHNKDFYHKLSTCKNLFNNTKVIISYDELSQEIRDTIHAYNDMNKNKQSCHFEL